jgi:HSF-type DNA-binding
MLKIQKIAPMQLWPLVESNPTIHPSKNLRNFHVILFFVEWHKITNSAANMNKSGNICNERVKKRMPFLSGHHVDNKSERVQCGNDRAPIKQRQGGITNTFPIKLHSMLQDLKQRGSYSDIVCWSEKGNSFVVLKPRDFTNLLLPVYFRTKKFSSFQRQLNAYGFTKFNLYACQEDIHVYYHNFFHRDHPDRLKCVKRRSSLDLNEAKPFNSKNISLSSKMSTEGKHYSFDFIKSIEVQTSNITQWQQTTLYREGNELKDLALDEAAAEIFRDKDAESMNYLGDLLKMWNPELEVLKGDLDNYKNEDYKFDLSELLVTWNPNRDSVKKRGDEDSDLSSDSQSEYINDLSDLLEAW